MIEDINKAVLGEGDAVFEVERSEELHAAAVAMARQAQQYIYIHSRHLDKAIYDKQDFLDELSRLVRSSPRATVRVLLQDSAPVVRDGHRLIHLAHRLSSFIHIRKPAEQYNDYNQAFMIVDGRGYTLRHLADRYEGVVKFNAPGEAAELVRYFDLVWEMSQPDPQLRRLDL